MKRRQFTASLATLAGLSTLFGRAAFAAFGLASETGAGNQLMARDRFEALLGRQFMAHGNGVDSKLLLSEVKSAVRGRDQQQFHVLFDAPAGRELSEGHYFLKTGADTVFGLHLLPGDTVAGRQKMIATINLQTAA
jgi:hypothetical protein